MSKLIVKSENALFLPSFVLSPLVLLLAAAATM